MVQIQPARRKCLKRLNNCPRLFFRQDLNYPPHPLVGFKEASGAADCRLDLKQAVGCRGSSPTRCEGEPKRRRAALAAALQRACNHPPTATLPQKMTFHYLVA
jgi:hypothetical protein